MKYPVCSSCGNEWDYHPDLPCISGRQIDASELWKKLFDEEFIQSQYGETYPIDLTVVMAAYIKSHRRAATLPPRRKLFTPPEPKPILANAPRRLPALDVPPKSPPAAPSGQAAQVFFSAIATRKALSKWIDATEKIRRERARLLDQLVGVADEMAQEMTATQFQRAKIAMGKARPEPLMEIKTVAGLSDTEIMSLTTTGRWPGIAQDLTIGWKFTQKASAANTARGAYKACQELKQQAGIGSGASSSSGRFADAKSLLRELLLASFPDVSESQLAGFLEALPAVMGAEFVQQLAQCIPFLNTVIATVKAAKEGKKALGLNSAAGNVGDAVADLRPETPGQAAAAAINLLRLYRNLRAAKSATNVAAAVSSLFDGGLTSGPVTSLAGATITAYKFYRAYREKSEVETRIRAGDYYGALQHSGTLGAYALVHYPAIGLVNPRVLAQQDFVPLGKTILGFYHTAQGPRIKQVLQKLRAAAYTLLDESPLTVSSLKKLKYAP